MHMDNFIKELTDLIKEQLGSDYDIRIEKRRKNNGTELHGLTILSKTVKENIVPTIYLEEFFNLFQSGITLDNITKRIIEVYKENSKKITFNFNDILDFNKIKNLISFHLINTELNTLLLDKVPHLEFLDLSIIFRINIISNTIGNGSILIKSDLLDTWGISVHELFHTAFLNTPKLMPCRIRRLSDVIEELHGEIDVDLCPLYVISNNNISNGCGCILYPDVLESFANTMRSDLYILPSSTHEMLILPISSMDISNMDLNELKYIVRMVNCTEVSKEDFLSNSVYQYFRKTKKIEIASE